MQKLIKSKAPKRKRIDPNKYAGMNEQPSKLSDFQTQTARKMI